jgi:DNA-directed RNA polymerase specialized sigma24 family protein
MTDDAQRKARAEAKRAQVKFERVQGQLEGAVASRRESFRRAAAAGLSMAEIGAAVGLHRTRVNQIINGK